MAIALIEGDAVTVMQRYAAKFGGQVPDYPVDAPARSAWQVYFSTAPYYAGTRFYDELGLRPLERTAR
ncbi:MAG: hypothetical protein ABEI52_08365, partial [Halobacteriaceae archaeon]